MHRQAIRVEPLSTAHALEALSMLVASPARKPRTPGPRDARLRDGRTCYDHFAGRLGVAITNALLATGVIVEEGQSFRFAEQGEGRLACLGIVVPEPRRSGRPACRWCLDWSERRPHLAGAIGARLTARSLEAGWVRRLEGSRAVQVTPAGNQVFKDVLGLHLGDMAHA